MHEISVFALFWGTRVAERIGGERVNGKVLVVFVALMAVTMLATPVMALGPANNPKAKVDPTTGTVILSTPSNNVHEFVQTGRINHYLAAKANGEGIINNVNLAVDSLADLNYLGQHSAEFMSMQGWVYLSGEETEGGTFAFPLFPTEGVHGAFYWFLRIFKVPAPAALAMANACPYGVYLSGTDLGWS